MRPQIVLDTNVLFAGLYSSLGASFEILRLIEKRRIDIHLSVPVVVEYADVLKRDSKRLGMTELEVDEVVDSLCAIGKNHKIYYLWRPTLPDPKDDLFLELAFTAQCPWIITHNIRDFSGIGNFGVEALSPIQFLKQIGASL